MKKQLVISFALILCALPSFSQNSALDPVPLDDTWKSKISRLAPQTTSAPVSKEHKVLLFSLFTGYEHWVIPHAGTVITTLAENTAAYNVVKSNDISMFEKKILKQFDAVVLNNNCSLGDRRDLFYDALGAVTDISEDERVYKAEELEKNLLSFVKKGGGLAVIHGGIVMQNNSEEFSDMLGGSFDYHPPQQEIELHIVEKDHPLTQAFEGKSFTHVDEPYFFKNAYAEKNFRPMLYMEIAKIQKVRHEPEDEISYVSWIKKYGKGRVFYVSPSHNAQSYEDSRILNYYLNGMQYILGDLKCDDSPLNQ